MGLRKQQPHRSLGCQSLSDRAACCFLLPRFLHVYYLLSQTPELLADIEVPESVSILGQTVDLSQVRGLLQPVSQGLSGIISQVRRSEERQGMATRRSTAAQ